MNITHKELMLLLRISQTAASRKLSRIKKKLRIKPFQTLSVDQLCEYLGWNVEKTTKKLKWS